MAWNRHYSRLEKLLVDILVESKEGMTLKELAKQIQELNPEALSGKTPKNSLYSVIYRREKRRHERGQEPIFRQIREGRTMKYSLSNSDPDGVGEEIKGNE